MAFARMVSKRHLCTTTESLRFHIQLVPSCWGGSRASSGSQPSCFLTRETGCRQRGGPWPGRSSRGTTPLLNKQQWSLEESTRLLGPMHEFSINVAHFKAPESQSSHAYKLFSSFFFPEMTSWFPVFTLLKQSKYNYPGKALYECMTAEGFRAN